MTGYYDAILGLIPLALLGGSSALYLSGLGTTVAITLASLVAVALMGHAMFVNAPVDDTGTTAGSPNAGRYPQAD